MAAADRSINITQFIQERVQFKKLYDKMNLLLILVSKKGINTQKSLGHFGFRDINLFAVHYLS